MASITFDIKEKVGKISESPKGWTRELNLVSWNSNNPKYDIRDWDPEHAKMSKGLTFTTDEIIALRDMLNTLKLD